METCVLIPSELSLVLSTDAGDGCQPGVWSNERIPRGRRFRPFQGTVRLDKLDFFTFLDERDVRHRFGCYDEIQDVNRRKIRHCNWIRFLRCSKTFSKDVNVLGAIVKGEPVYETVSTVSPNTELVVYFEDSEHEKKAFTQEVATRNFIVAQNRHTMGIILEDTPLDLSRSLLSTQVPVPTCVINKCHLLSPSTILSPNIDFNESFTPVKRINKQCLGEVQQLPYKKNKERSLLPCEVCGKAFDRPSLLRRHMRTHTGEKPHVCEVCGKGFSTSSSLNTHRRIHSGEKPHQCHVCGKRFTASSNLYYHRMTHSKEKPHKCSLCSKSFPTPGDLKSHMYVHNGSWPYKCHICNRGFSKQTNLKNHLFLHTGDKPHVCEHCQKRFALACNLRAHLKTHEGETQEKCNNCEKTFPTTSGLLLHGCCQDCYHSNNGIALTKKEDELSTAITQNSSKDSSDSSPDLGYGVDSRRHLMMDVLDEVMLRYEQAKVLLAGTLQRNHMSEKALALAWKT